MTGPVPPRVNLTPHPLYERGYPAFPMIPFSVIDRPNHMMVLRTLDLYGPNQVVPIGVMTHAHLSPNMQRLVREFPCDGQGCTGVLGAACPFRESSERCPYREHIRRRMVWMCDSGAFTRQGAPGSYSHLFELYDRLGVEYGIIADVLRNSAATLESARQAMAAYPPYRSRFSLVGVTQGNTVEDYLACYRALKALGFRFIAVGGLLCKVQGAARYTRVASETLMWAVLSELRDLYPDDWLFALGSLHPCRIEELVRYRVWADSKRWLFQYRSHTQEYVSCARGASE
jgi:hypothetical protein